MTAAAQRRFSLAGRSLAASAGGYAFAHAATAFLTLALPFARADRVIAATLLAFAVWCVVAIYAFTASKAWRVWTALILGGALMYGVAAAFPDMAARP